MKRLSETDRARITIILSQLIIELSAGDSSAVDDRTSNVIAEAVDLCCRSKMESLDDSAARAIYTEAFNLVIEKDWVFTIRKIGDDFKVEAKFGRDVANAKLAKSVVYVSKAGIN
jgi:hypothetical protein